MSTVGAARVRATVTFLAVALVCAASGCGWHAGSGPIVALSAGAVDGATVEPELRAGLADAFAREVARRRLQAGPVATIHLVSVDVAPEAALPGVSAGTVAWTARLSVRVDVDGKPGCEATVDGRQTYASSTSEPYAAALARRQAFGVVADDVAARAVDVLLGNAKCR